MAEVETRRRRARRGEGERLRGEILDATERLLVERGGSDAVSIRAVCELVGVSPPSIYLHFVDKTDLIFAVCERQFANLAEALERAEERAASALDAVLNRGLAYMRFGLAHPEEYRVLFMGRPPASPGEHPAERYTGQDVFRGHLDAVTRCIDEGMIPSAADPMTVTCGLVMLVHGVTSMVIAKPQFPWPEAEGLLTHLQRSYLEGLQVEAEGPSRSPG
ncbi:MAG: TetR/AcrR family transcriptional regulator [Actinobacteria bacterium]|nr:TetR/AcrR family transcriptional regulator [Actinomycetota bacterium]